MKRKINILIIALLAVMTLFQNPISAMAITTEFMVPTIDPNDTSRTNVLYSSPNKNVQVSKFSYGLVGDVLNTSGLDAVISELSANSDPSQYGNSIVGIYMEGATLTDAHVSTLAAEGWKKVELYYEKYMISGSVPSRGMHPVIEIVNDVSVTETLTNAGFTGQVGVFKVSDVSMTEPLAILYAPEFSFLRGSTIQAYKYIPDIQKFVVGPSVMYDGYDRSFMDMEGLHLADGDPNGTFVVLTQALPSDLVITKDQIQTLRDQLQQENASTESDKNDSTATDNSQTTEDGNNNDVVVTNKDNTVAWTFADGVTPDDFTAEATVEASDKKEVKVDFEFSGKLPKGTQVTIQIPEGVEKFEDGKTVYFYYCNPETEEREYVSEGKCQGGKVTFDIEHCSEYVITTEKLVEVDIVEKGPNLLPIIAVFMIAFCGTGFVIYTIVKKRKAN